MVGPTRQGVDDLIALDSGATWNGTQIAGSNFPEFSSPRVVPVVVFDIDEFIQHDLANDWSGYGCPTGGGCVKVVNLLGFFVESMSGRNVTGILLTYPGEFDSSKGIVNNSASFSTVIQLIQ